MHVRGYKEHGDINAPLEQAMRSQIDRFNLGIEVIDRVPRLQIAGAHAKEQMRIQIFENSQYAREEGIDKPEITGWKWPFQDS